MKISTLLDLFYDGKIDRPENLADSSMFQFLLLFTYFGHIFRFQDLDKVQETEFQGDLR